MDIYLKIDAIVGDVNASTYEGCISVESLDFGVDGTSMANLLEGSQQAVLRCVTLTKRADRSSAAIFKHSCNGNRLPNATISFLRPGDQGTGVEYMQYLLEDLVIGSYSISSNPGENALPLETIKLVFRRITFKYTVFDKKGDKGTLMRAGYDIDKGLTM